MILSDKSNKVIIDSCPIYDNWKFGAHFMGHDGQAMITKFKFLESAYSYNKKV